MKFWISLFLISLGTYAGPCSKVGVELYGDLILMKKEEGKIKKVVYTNPFPKRWNVNSDLFENLYLKSSKGLEAYKIELEITSQKRKKFKKTIKANLEKKEGALYKIKNVNFKKDVLPPFNLFPATMELILKNSNEVCRETFSLEVLK